MSSQQQLVWVITGTSSGLGHDLTLAALARGDKVIATARARSIGTLDDLNAKGADTLELDVTAPLDTLKEVAKKAVEIHGRVDVVVNSAGYILAGALEENTPEETYDLFNTNVFGALNVTRAFLPYMRQRKTGTIVWMGSLTGWISGPAAGLYCTTKYALRGISGTLHEEISPLGLRSTCIDFGAFRTNFLSPGHRVPYDNRIEDYRETGTKLEEAFGVYDHNQPGDPAKGVQIMIDVVKGEGIAKDKPFPKSLQLGTDCYGVVKNAAEETLKNLEAWKDVTCSTEI